MARQARGEVIDPQQVQIVHCVQRCVRRAFLCGVDPYSGHCYEHRREWIRDRLEFLASVFGIDCLTYTVMSNHLHLILRSRPDVVAGWSDREVAERWCRLFPKRCRNDGRPAEPNEQEINSIVNQPEVLAERRRRLSDLSWWMRCVSENIARQSNREDDVTGHFWEGRYRAQVLLDETAILACAAYVDLNPIRAAIAESPENSLFTGAKDRIDDLQERDDLKEGSDRSRLSDHVWERSRQRRRSGWMSPLQIDERLAPTDSDSSRTKRRASEKGFLSVSLQAYLELLDWTGRQIRSDKQGAIPDHLEPILTRIGLDSTRWCELVVKFGRFFKRAVGTEAQMRGEAARRGQRWLQAAATLA